MGDRYERNRQHHIHCRHNFTQGVESGAGRHAAARSRLHPGQQKHLRVRGGRCLVVARADSRGRAGYSRLQLHKEARPMGVAFDAARKRIYMSTGRGGTIAVAEQEGDGAKLLKEIPVGSRPWGIALSRDGRRLYTANGSSNDVTVVDTSSLSVLKKIPVGKGPWGVVWALKWPSSNRRRDTHRPRCFDTAALFPSRGRGSRKIPPPSPPRVA